MSKTIRFNAFEMNCVGHQSPGLWRHPRDRSWEYKDLEYWTDLAKLLETGFFESVFIADVVGYSRLMEADEAETLAALKDRRQRILGPVVRSHDGRVIKVMGDGVLIEFASAVNAVALAPFGGRHAAVDHR